MASASVCSSEGTVGTSSPCENVNGTQEAEAMDVTENGQTTNGANGDVPSLDVQKTTVFDLSTTSLKAGDSWFVLDSRWFQKWKSYVGYTDHMFAGSSIGFETDSPGPIDSSTLCTNGVLQQQLLCDVHYSLVPQETWNNLVAWYGIADSVSPIARRVIEVGTLRTTLVEVYRPELQLCEHDCETFVYKDFSRADTLEHVCTVAKEVFLYPPDSKCRLWSYLTDYELISDMAATLDEADVNPMDRVMIERQQPDGKWPRTTGAADISSAADGNSSVGAGNTVSQPRPVYSNSSYSSSSYYSNNSYSTWSASSRQSPPGLCGLSNLGNTCFMNSALQCLSNTHLLTSYLLANRHIDEINTENPLGMQGQVANAYGRLLKEIWSGNHSVVSPREFKSTVSRFAPQFSGYAQHDSQELLAFLLDGLHEDLNRIRKKPYIELKDSDDRTDRDVAAEAWDAHRQRNDSIIVDMFQGQFKSRLVCPTCQKVSVTFDPFMFLSLPLPIKKTRMIEVTLVFLDPARHPKSFTLTVPKHGSVKSLLKELAQQSDVAFKQLVCADVYNHRFHKIFGMGDSLSSILDRDVIFAYELQAVGEDDDAVSMPVYHREQDHLTRSTYYYHSQPSFSLFGFPFFVTVPRRGTTYKALRSKIVHQLSRFVHPERCVIKPVVSAEPLPKQGESQVNSTCDGDSDLVNGNLSEEEAVADQPSTQLSDAKDEAAAADDGDENQDITDQPSTVAENGGDDGNGTNGISPVELFSLSVINSYGGTAITSFEDDGSELDLPRHTYLGLDWSDSQKKMAYDEEEADRCDSQPSPADTVTSAPRKIQLTDCLQLFTTEEQLGEDDPWYCPQCKEHKQAMKKFDIWKLPKVLVIHLKRFSYNRYWRDKLDTMVHFPVKNLDLRPYCLDQDPGYEAIYDLHAVSNHFGGMGGGHYTAFGLHHDKEKWYDFDDSSVTAVSEKELHSTSAYVLFYTRRDAATEPSSSLGTGEASSSDGSSASSEVTLPAVPTGNGSDSEDAAMEDEPSVQQ